MLISKAGGLISADGIAEIIAALIALLHDAGIHMVDVGIAFDK